MNHWICRTMGGMVALYALLIVVNVAGMRVQAQPPSTTQMAVDVAHLQSDVAMLKDTLRDTNTSMREMTAIVQQQVGSNKMLTVVVGILVTLVGAIIAARPWRKVPAPICSHCGKKT